VDQASLQVKPPLGSFLRGCRSPPEGGRLTELVQQAGVGRRELEVVQLRGSDPGQGRALEGARLARPQAAKKEFEVDCLFGIGMGQALQTMAHLDFDAQFFSQFTGQALGEGFLRAALSAGEFPQPAQVRVRVALSNEESALAEEQAGGHLDGGVGGG
jgi:hypothetical protein